MTRKEQVDRIIASWEADGEAITDEEIERAWAVAQAVERASTPEEIGVAAKRWHRN